MDSLLFSFRFGALSPGKRFRLIAMLLACLPALACGAANETFYVDSVSGNDANDGLAPEKAWKTLQKAGSRDYTEGQQLLLRDGSVFTGTLMLRAKGSAQAPVTVGAYAADGASGHSAGPVIDAKGFLAGVQITNSSYVEVRDLDITSDAGTPVESAAGTKRYGVLITGTRGQEGHVTLRSLHIHDIFATTLTPLKGRNEKASDGIGIESSGSDNLLVQNCTIEKTGFVGIFVHETDGISILNNTLHSIGGPGMKPGRCSHLLVSGNFVDGTGSSVDPRMDGRGSGIWPWTCTDVQIERNVFMHARGKQDSCGAHIDFDNTNVVIQQNLSIDNEGGFVEILGNNHNCAYRYNISINDGWRVRGQDGALANGHILWVSGFDGEGKKQGPYDTYIYNNTIFVKSDIRAGFEIEPTTQGMLVANNIFYIQGELEHLTSPWKKKKGKGEKGEKGGKFENVIFQNNLATKPLPNDVSTQNIGELSGDPQFKSPGGFNPSDYIPGNVAAVKGTGAVIAALPGDSVGLKSGFLTDTDFFGNKIPPGAPDLGAIVFGGAQTQPPAAGASAGPAK